MDLKRCRICLTSEEELISLYESIGIMENVNYAFADVIMQTCQIEISPDDNKPQNICLECSQTARVLLVYKKKCKISDRVLNAELSTVVKLEIDEENIQIEESMQNSNDMIVQESIEEMEAEDNIEETDDPLKNAEDSSNSKPNVCRFCNKRYRRKYVLRIHERVHTGEESFECNICRKTFHHPYAFEVHLWEVHNIIEMKSANKAQGNVKKICEDLFVPPANKTHENTNDIEEKGKNVNTSKECEFIEVESNFEENIKIEIEENSQDETHKCDSYGLHFESQDLLMQHKSSTHMFFEKCKFCDFTSNDNTELTKHCEETHDTDIDSKFDCETCGANLNSESALHQHQTTHENEKFFECRKCDTRFDNINIFRQHLKSHMASVYKCEKCKKTFTTKRSMFEHTLRHSDVRGYQCEMCKKSFKTKSELNRHNRRGHDTENMFECEFCDKKYFKLLDLKWHMKTHTGEEPIQCNLCNKQFLSDVYLRRHSRKFHASIESAAVNVKEDPL